MYECARALKKAPSTISLIVNSDVFKAHYDERRRHWQELHDHSIVHKTTRIAEESLDLTLEVLKQRRTSVPLSQLVTISESALGRLGYGVRGQPGQVTVNVGPGAGASVVAIPRGVLAEARSGLRAVEQQKIIDITPVQPAVSSEKGVELEVVDALPASSEVSAEAPKEESDAPPS